MDLSYRPLPPAHDPAFRRLLSYAFTPENGPADEARRAADGDDDAPERPDIFRPRGLYAVERAGDAPGDRASADASGRGTTAESDWGRERVAAEIPAADDLRAVCGYYAFTARIRGAWWSVGGVSAVASPPETRRRGHVAALLDGLHRELREEGFAFAVLWPFEYGFYRRFGYAITGEYARATLPPADLGDAAGEPAGAFRRLTPDDRGALDAVHAAWATEALAIRRTEGWWRHRVFSGWGTDPYVYGWERDGRLRGYLVYTVEADDDGKTMAVSELAAVDEEARRQLLRFCRDHDSQVERVRLRGPVVDDLFDLLADPRAADVQRRPGSMVRLVDVRAALESLAYPDGAAESVTLAVEDGDCPWNDGTVELTVGEGGATCLPSDGDPDCRLGVGALSQLAVGARSVGRLERLGRLSADESIVETLSELFPAEPVYLRKRF